MVGAGATNYAPAPIVIPGQTYVDPNQQWASAAQVQQPVVAVADSIAGGASLGAP